MRLSAAIEGIERMRSSFRGSAALAVSVGVLGVTFAAPAWAGCKSDEECKGGRVCSPQSECVATPGQKDPQDSCQRDIDCAADDVCEQHVCIPQMPNAPGTQPSQARPPMGSMPPGAQPPPPPPIPPDMREPPPDYQLEPEGPPPPPQMYLYPPYPYPRRIRPMRPPPLPMPWRFDLLLGATYLSTESDIRDFARNDFGISVDAQIAKGVTPHIALGLRAGTVLIPYSIGPVPAFQSSTAYGAVGLYSDTFHWGLFLGGGTAVSPTDGVRQGGFVMEIPIDWAIGPYMKVGLAIDCSFYPEFSQQNIRFVFGL